MNAAPGEYESILRPLSRSGEQNQQYPIYLQCNPATPPMEPTMVSPKDISNPILRRLQHKVELANGDVLSFSDIADFYSDCLPISTRVFGGGFYGVGGELTIGENETLYIHTALKVDAAIAELSHKRKYSIPLTFAVPFGVVYNPSNNAAAAITEDHRFESVEKVLSGKELPKVIRTECNTTDTAGCVVNCGEILIVKGSPAPKQLNVCNVSTGATHTLCKGSFSANPNLMKMSLQQIHHFAHDLLPCQVVLCCEDYPNVNAPDHLTSCVFTIRKFKNSTTLLVTNHLDTDIAKLKVMELPSDLQFQVQVTGTDTWSSMKTTKMISESYPNLPDLYRYLGMPNEKMRQGQLFFYGLGSRPTSENDFKSKNAVVEYDYVDMTRPASEPLSPSHGVLSCANTSDKLQGNEISKPGNNHLTLLPATPIYQTIGSPLPQDIRSQQLPPQPKKRTQVAGTQYEVPTSIASSIPPPPRQMSEPQARPAAPLITPRPRPQVRSQVPESIASAAAAPVKPPVQTSKDTPDVINLHVLTDEVLRLKQEWADMKYKMNGVVEMVRQICDKPELSYLDTTSRGHSRLSVDDVAALLLSAGLEQYGTMFRNECIDGDVLCELDDHTLEKELSISSKLHRLRLLRLIRDQRLLQLQF